MINLDSLEELLDKGLLNEYGITNLYWNLHGALRETARLRGENAGLRDALRDAVAFSTWDFCLVCGDLPSPGVHDDFCWVPRAVGALRGGPPDGAAP